MPDTHTVAEEPPKQSRDAAYWASTGSTLHVGAQDAPEDALRANVEGRQVTGPIRGFGQLWRKTYRVALEGARVTPVATIETWKLKFPDFWPEGNHFYAPLTGIKPGDVALIKNDLPGGLALSTGVMVLYADDESFTFITPEGHVFAGWITFSAYVEGATTVAQAQVLMRAHDPMIEIAMRLGGHRQEDKFWQDTLRALVHHFGVEAGPKTEVVCLDRKVQWSHMKNMRYNAMMGSVRYAFSAAAGRLRSRQR